MRDLRRVALIAATAVTLAAGMVGCGVSTSDPIDIGDGIAPAGPRTGGDGPPTEDKATLPLEQVTNYLAAAAEGGVDPPVFRMSKFLTPNANQTVLAGVDRQSTPNPTVIRVLGRPVVAQAPGDPRTAVDVRYEVVGTLNDQGRVNELSEASVDTMRFWVENGRVRIDQIDGAPAPIMISDAALREFYDVQPIYFWDATDSTLVPDIRYIPTSLTADARAARVVQWLTQGPSGWLSGVKALRGAPTVKSQVLIKDGKVRVNLTTDAGLGGQPAVLRLYHQLQWSLQTGAGPAQVELSIDDKVVTNLGGVTDYLISNQSYSQSRTGQKYDIVESKVLALSVGVQPAVLGNTQNAGVNYAAVNRNATVVALVTRVGQSQSTSKLQLIRDGGQAATVVSGLPTVGMQRPAWVYGDLLLVPAGGRLWSVTAAGVPLDVTPSRVSNVSKVAVSPDGRRVAIIAAGQVYVSTLTVGETGVTVGPNVRQILAGQVTAAGVGWASEGWLYVAGLSAAGAPALWRVTADGVIGDDRSAAAVGITPTDLVVYPTAPFAPNANSPEVYLSAGAAVYLVQSELTQDAKLRAPFFAL